MEQRYDNELSPEVREKMKKNTVYIGAFSVAMIFAGLTSAYIVSMGDSFWVKYNFPPAFYISTIFIVLSSIVLQLGISMSRKSGNPKAAKIAVPLTFLLGIGFGVFQWMGYGELVDRGAYLSSKITVSTGRYGAYYELKVNDKYMEVDGNDYYIAGKLVQPTQKKAIAQFAQQFEHITKTSPSTIQNYGQYKLLYKQQEVSIKDNHFYIQDSIQLQYVDLIRLEEFSWHVRDERGDFFHKGTYGKDFVIYYKGKKLDYKNRQLYYNGTKLSAPLQLKMDDTADSSSSYLYIITFLHLLHIVGTLIFMLLMTIRSFSDRLEKDSYLAIRVGGIFWHFLGLLWLYLLLFLLFIH